MKQMRPKGIRVGSSDPDRLNDLKENHKKIQEMLDNGWSIKATKVRRPRIKRTKPEFKMFGTIEVKFDIPIEILIKAGFA